MNYWNIWTNIFMEGMLNLKKLRIAIILSLKIKIFWLIGLINIKMCLLCRHVQVMALSLVLLSDKLWQICWNQINLLNFLKRIDILWECAIIKVLIFSDYILKFNFKIYFVKIMSQSYDFVVVGAGTMGRSTALYLTMQYPEARCALV